MKFVIAVLLVLIIFSTSSVFAARTELDRFCGKKFRETGQCYEGFCQTRCYGGLNYAGCDIECFGMDCAAITVDQCPSPTCQVLKGCDGKRRCLPNEGAKNNECGASGYYGEKLSCCDGLSKRCGFPVYDGTCDDGPENSVYSAPMCLPCGNGICDTLENRCNCPEDCKY